LPEEAWPRTAKLLRSEDEYSFMNRGGGEFGNRAARGGCHLTTACFAWGAVLTASVSRVCRECAEVRGKAKSNEIRNTNEVFRRFDHLRWNPKSGRFGNGLHGTRSVLAKSTQGGGIMKSGLRDQVEGSVKEAKGAAKQKLSKMTGD